MKMFDTANQIIDFYYNSKEHNAALWDLEYYLKELRDCGPTLSFAFQRREIEYENQISEFKKRTKEECLKQLRIFIELKLYKKKPLQNPRVTIEQKDCPTLILESNKVTLDVYGKIIKFGDELTLKADTKDLNHFNKRWMKK